MAKPHPRLLLVEGREDKFVIPQFMEKFIPWGESNEPQKWPVLIKDFDGIEPLLKPGAIEVELKSPGLKALGVMVDANSDPVSRFRSIRDRVIKGDGRSAISQGRLDHLNALQPTKRLFDDVGARSAIHSRDRQSDRPFGGLRRRHCHQPGG